VFPAAFNFAAYSFSSCSERLPTVVSSTSGSSSADSTVGALGLVSVAPFSTSAGFFSSSFFLRFSFLDDFFGVSRPAVVVFWVYFVS
jgi:hypothetical protein